MGAQIRSWSNLGLSACRSYTRRVEPQPCRIHSLQPHLFQSITQTLVKKKKKVHVKRTACTQVHKQWCKAYFFPPGVLCVMEFQWDSRRTGGGFHYSSCDLGRTGGERKKKGKKLTRVGGMGFRTTGQFLYTNTQV